MGNLGGPEILVILLVALIFLGPSKLPEVARQIGKAMTEVRKVTSGFQREINDAFADDSDARARGAAIAATRPAAPVEPTPSSAPAEPASTATAEPDSTAPTQPSTEADR